MKKNIEDTNKSVVTSPPANSPEAREARIISAAMDLAEKQIMEGTASSQVITHFLKLGTEKEKTERRILLEQEKLIAAKTEALQTQKRTEEMFIEAIKAFGIYSGNDNTEEE